jgi:hypothetical protein
MGQPDLRPVKRHVDPEAGKEKVEAEGRCRVCKRKTSPWWKGGSRLKGLTRSHLVPRILGGDDVDDNIMPLCGMGAGSCHHMSELGDVATRMAIRAVMTEAEQAYVIGRKSEFWLEQRYPSQTPRRLRVK